MFVLALLISAALAVDCKTLVTGGYSVAEAFDCIDTIMINSQNATNMRDALKVLFESYVFKDILKNPPQPEHDDKFFPSIDIDKELDALPVSEEQQMYPFMRKIQKIIDTTHDLHLSFRMTSNENNTWYYDNFYAALPLSIDIVNDEYIMNVVDDVLTYNVHIKDEIWNNNHVAIESINGESPYEFIKYFADQFTFLKSPHGRFTYAMETLSYVSLRSMPLPREYLDKEFTFVLKNGVNFTVSYTMVYITPEHIGVDKLKYLRDREQYNMAPLKISDFSTKEFIKASNVFDMESNDENLACKTDHEKKVNLIILKTFYPVDNYLNFFAIFNKCIKQIDENTYPIIVILPMNGGGLADLEANFEQTLAPHADVDLIGSVRISPASEGVMKYSYGEFLYDTQKCEPLYLSKDKTDPLGEFYSKPKSTKYGDVEHVYSQESLMHASTMLKSRLTKNPRNPTDVVLFTDGFCYSACSVLTKGMVNKGNGIVVGYQGDPKGDMKSFDAGNSPTPVVTQTDTHLPEADVLASLGGMMKISYYETFEWNYDYTETIPREFVLNPVDERVNIYRYNISKIDQFIDEGLKIYEKYQTQCNPLNKRLVKVDPACDAKLNIEHAHGGHICTDEGVWSTECTASYCDAGYKFDRFNMKCIVDVCYKPEEESSVAPEPTPEPEEPSEQPEPEEPSEQPEPKPEPEEPSEQPQPEPTPDPEPVPEEPEDDDNGEDEGLSETEIYIIAGVCGGVVVLLIVGLFIGLVVYFIHKRRNRASEYNLIE